MAHEPHNRLGIDYRTAPTRKVAVGITDIHSHVRDVAGGRRFFEAADLYGVQRVYTMSPLDAVDDLSAAFGDRLRFIAVPRWDRMRDSADDVLAQWPHDLAAFRERGATICKFWMAPPMRARFDLTLEHPSVRPVIDAALDLGYEFMTHIADPTIWWKPGGRYADEATWGSKRDQYDQLAWFLEYVQPRRVIGAHFGGNVEDPGFLADWLERYPNYYLDTSATKWIVREVAARTTAVRDLVVAHADRILFGSDLVTAPHHPFEHYASRYWAHQQMWETDYVGESPIEDPDADPPRLGGIDLPADVLRKIYRENADRFAST